VSVLDRLAQEADEATKKAERLNRIVQLANELGEDGLAELVEWISVEGETNGNGNGHSHEHAAPANPDAPRGRDAVRRIVSKRAGIWTLAELRAEMEARGWFTSANGLEAAAKRLCDVNGEGRRVGRGRYVFPANHGEEDAIESDPSDGATIPFAA
jgi:hypothetical protein